MSSSRSLLNTGSHQRKFPPRVTRSLRVVCRCNSAVGQDYFLTDSTLLGVADSLSQPALTTWSPYLYCHCDPEYGGPRFPLWSAGPSPTSQHLASPLPQMQKELSD